MLTPILSRFCHKIQILNFDKSVTQNGSYVLYFSDMGVTTRNRQLKSVRMGEYENVRK
jgi:hypothetical protein